MAQMELGHEGMGKQERKRRKREQREYLGTQRIRDHVAKMAEFI